MLLDIWDIQTQFSHYNFTKGKLENNKKGIAHVRYLTIKCFSSFITLFKISHMMKKEKPNNNKLWLPKQSAGEGPDSWLMHMYAAASHPEVMSHVPSRCECKHICDYPICKRWGAVLAPFLS